MDFKQLEAFVYVVNFQSFSKAAEKLYLTQPTISAHVSSLEHELKTQLIIRTPREACPTGTGKILYEYALEMLSLRENATAACSKKRVEMKGEISIAASTIPYQHVLPQVMSEFRLKYPDITFHVLNCDSVEVIKKIAAGEAEVGMTGTALGNAKCSFQEFMDDYLVVITPNTAEYSSVEGNSFDTEAFRHFPFIIREPGSGTRKETEAYFLQKGLPLGDLNIAAQLDNPDAVKNSVRQGLGISIVSQLTAADYAQFGLIRVFHPEGGPIRRKLYLVRHKRRHLTPLASAFMSFALQYYKQSGLGQ